MIEFEPDVDEDKEILRVCVGEIDSEADDEAEIEPDPETDEETEIVGL